MSEADSVEDELSEPVLSDYVIVSGMVMALGTPWQRLKAKALLVTGLIERCVNAWASVSDRMESAGETVHDAVEKPVRGIYRGLHKSPGAVIVILLLVTGFIGQYSVDFQHQINGDVEVYLPDGAESKDLLLEVREGWSTDIVMLYVLSLIHISEPTRRVVISYAVFCLKKKK